MSKFSQIEFYEHSGYELTGIVLDKRTDSGEYKAELKNWNQFVALATDITKKVPGAKFVVVKGGDDEFLPSGERAIMGNGPFMAAFRAAKQTRKFTKTRQVKEEKK